MANADLPIAAELWERLFEDEASKDVEVVSKDGDTLTRWRSFAIAHEVGKQRREMDRLDTHWPLWSSKLQMMCPRPSPSPRAW